VRDDVLASHHLPLLIGQSLSSRSRAHSSARLAHVGIAVPSLVEALRFYHDVLGLDPAGGPETADGATIVSLPFGDTSVELLEPPHPATPVAKSPAKRGPGPHHVDARVPA